MDAKGASKLAGKFLPLAIGGYFLTDMFYSVQPGEGALRFNYFSGLGKQVYTEGINMKLPFIESAIKFNLRTMSLPADVSAQNRDLQECFISAQIFYKPDIHKLDVIYRTLGQDYAQIVMNNIVREVLRGIVAQYNAQQLITQRDQLSNQVRNAIALRARYYNILIEGCTISNIRFSQNYQRAVDEKQAAQQEAERAKYIVEQSLYQKKSIIQRAQTDAEGIMLIGEQVKENPAFMDLQKINFAIELSEILSKSRNKILLNTDMLLLDIFSDVVSDSSKK
jgi:prohibitin 2